MHITSSNVDIQSRFESDLSDGLQMYIALLWYDGDVRSANISRKILQKKKDTSYRRFSYRVTIINYKGKDALGFVFRNKILLDFI